MKSDHYFDLLRSIGLIFTNPAATLPSSFWACVSLWECNSPTMSIAKLDRRSFFQSDSWKINSCDLATNYLP